MSKKRKVIWNSNLPILKTGLARNTRSVLEYLHKTGKFSITLYAQGVLYESPEYNKFPYKVIGCLPNNQQELDNINSDPNYSRLAGYGGHMIDKVLQDEKPDVLILSDDIWGFPYTEKPWATKFPVVYHITVDSTPVLQEAFNQASKTPYYFTWADFANEEFHKRGLNHVKSIPGAIDPKDFYKLSFIEKLDLKNKFNIPPNSFICGFVFRNQLRKEVGPLIEGYSLWKKQNPEIKNTYLLLHTHFSEPGGWDIHRFCDSYGVDKNEVLTTYICKSCLEIEVKPFTGQDKDCRFCGANNSQITCNVGIGCTEQQLNQVYNLMDCYVHPMNAGGLEIPIIESLYCEIPAATVEYSCGGTFTRNSFVFTIEAANTIQGPQHGTQFNRACPYPSSIAKFLNKIYQLEPRKRQEIGKRGREWALSKFSPEIVGKQWEDLIDSIPDHNYNFDFKEDLKNPDFPMPDIENDEEWLISLYNNILKCTPDSDGLTNWLQGLKNGRSRNQIYDFFIDLARKENNSKYPQTISIDQIFPRVEGKKNVLLVCPMSIGDNIIMVSLLPKVIEKYPLENHQIFLTTDPKYFEIFSMFPEIKLIPFHPSFKQELLMYGAGGKGVIDYFVDVFCSTQTHLNYLTNKY